MLATLFALSTCPQRQKGLKYPLDYAMNEEKKGTLESGKFADLAVLTADPLTVEELKIAEIGSQMTMVGGKIVHEVPNWSQ